MWRRGAELPRGRGLQFSQTVLNFRKGLPVSGGLMIVLIIVVWLFVLAPWLLRSQRPVSRTGEAFDDTRVLFEGDSGTVPNRRRPQFRPDDVRPRGAVADYENAEYVEVDEHDDAPRQTIAGAAAAAKADAASQYAEHVSETDTDSAPQHEATAANDAMTIDGEVVEETAPEESHSEADDVELAEQAQDTADNMIEAEGSAEAAELDGAAEADADSAAADELDADYDDGDADLLSEELGAPRAKRAKKLGKPSLFRKASKPDAADVEAAESTDESGDAAAFESEVFSAPAIAEDAYDLDETYTSPVDLMYPGEVDPEIKAASAEESDLERTLDSEIEPVRDAEDSEADGEAAATEASAGVDHTPGAEDSAVLAPGQRDELSAEELEFAQRRRGRGGWDPEADEKASANRYQRRQRTLIGLAVAVVLSVAVGIVLGGWAWAVAAAVGAITVAYLIALRAQVRQEQALRARRIKQLRRARLGVRSADHEALDIPRNLRRPGAIVLEMDDDSPDFEQLPVYYADNGDDFHDPRSHNHRHHRDDLAARRVG